jgi:quercetin dioxygenase-like cupin family protein
MKLALGAALLSAVVAAVAVAAYAAETEHDKHIFVTEAQVQWKPAPASLKPGAQVAVLYGDPAKAGLFVMRIKLPKGYRIAPHTHPKTEIVTVLSGVFVLGMGTDPKGETRRFPAGSFFALEPGVVHHALGETETVVQLSAMGPWAINYANPADDPRKAAQ